MDTLSMHTWKNQLNLATVRRSLSLVPFDTQTEQGRSDERYRLAALSILTNVLSRLIGVVAMLLSVSLTVPYLGVERFGVWMTIASFAGLLTFLDLGIGNALTNHVAHRAATEDPDLLSQTISGGLAFLALIGMGMALLLYLIAANLPWHILVKVDQPALLPEARLAAMCFALLFGFHIFTSGIQRVFAGMQQAYLGHLATALGSLVACFGLWFSAGSHQGIPVLLTVMLGSQSAAGLLLLGLLFARRQFTFVGILGFAKLESTHIFRAGGLFFILQIGTMVGWGADSLLIASTLGVAQVAIYSVVQRLFQFATQPLGIMNAPLWGAYADAHVRNDKIFIKKTLKKSMILTLSGASLVSAFLLHFHPWLIEKWTHGKIAVPLLLVAIYAVWVVLDACGNAFAMFLNGCNIIKQQIVTVIILTSIALPVKIISINYYGISGLVSSYSLIYFIVVIMMYGIYYKKEIRENIE